MIMFTRTWHWTYPVPLEFIPHVTTYFLKIHFNIMLPSMLRSPVWSPPFRISDGKCYPFIIFSFLCYTPHLFDPLWFDPANNTKWDVQIMELLMVQLFPGPRSQYSPQCPVFKYTLCSSLRMAIIPNFLITYSIWKWHFYRISHCRPLQIGNAAETGTYLKTFWLFWLEFSTVTRIGVGWQRSQGSVSGRGRDFFISKAYKLAVGLTQTSIH